MTLNGHFASKSVSGSATNGLASGFRTKLFENLQSYPYTVSNKNVAQGKVYADIRGGSLERGHQVKVGSLKNGDFRFIRSLSSEHFTYMATRQLSDDTTVNDLGHISRSLDSFTSNF